MTISAADTPLRRATPGDLDAVTDFHVAVWRATYRDIAPAEAIEKLDHAHRRQSWERTLADPARHTLFARANGAISGLVSFGPPSYGAFGDAGEIKHLYVATTYRRTGLGQRLLLAARSALLDTGFPATALAVVSENRDALAFYRATGGKTVGRFTDPGPLWRSDNLVIRWEHDKTDPLR